MNFQYLAKPHFFPNFGACLCVPARRQVMLKFQYGKRYLVEDDRVVIQP